MSVARTKWWWTFAVRKAAVCGCCGEPIPFMEAFAWNHDRELVMCKVCVGNHCITPGDSHRYLSQLTWRRRARKGQLARARQRAIESEMADAL
jgi:hypothetical protein